MGMPSTSLKDKLTTLLDKWMLTTGQGKTESLQAIATPLGVKSRQLYKWLNDESTPHNAKNILVKVEALLANPEMGKTETSPGQVAKTDFPFRIRVEKKALVVSKDPSGDFLIDGIFSIEI